MKVPGVYLQPSKAKSGEVLLQMGGKRSVKTKTEPMDTFSGADTEIRMEEERVLNVGEHMFDENY